MESRWMLPSEAGEKLHLTKAAVFAALKRGALTAITINGAVLITRESVDRLTTILQEETAAVTRHNGGAHDNRA